MRKLKKYHLLLFIFFNYRIFSENENLQKSCVGFFMAKIENIQIFIGTLHNYT